MRLALGTKLGPYEILAALGAGGMGEVYRARDARLGRDVALKVLPSAVADDPSRRQRFELEARAVAALNHPNIVAIYDIGAENGIFYIVSELVDGESPCGAKLGLRKALDVAAQMASGLAAAHAAGITHRDLKPANILITRDGRVKILDFGLAKIRTFGTADVSATAPMSVHTEPGMVMGTVGYMSPEQVHGQDVDERSDIFSLGVILYELLSGERPFRGETAIDTMQAILRQDPAELPESVPAPIRQTVAHCLEKEPGNRFQSAQDLSFALAHIGTQSDATPVLVRPIPWPRWATIALVAAAIGGLAGAFLRRAPEPPQWLGTMLGGPDMALNPRISPDDHLLAFQAIDRGLTQVAVMKPESGNWSTLTHRRDLGVVWQISWSPDGALIYYDRQTDALQGVYSVPLLGGEERLVLASAGYPEALLDGSLLVVRSNSERRPQYYRFWPETGRLQDLPLLSASLTHRSARALPGGKEAIIFGTPIGNGDLRPGLFAVDLASNSMRRLTPATYHDEAIMTFAVSRDGKSILATKPAGTMVRLVSIPTSGPFQERTLFTATSQIRQLDGGPGGSVYATMADRPADVVRLSAGGGSPERIGSFPQIAYVHSIMALPDGRFVVPAGAPGHIRLMAVAKGREPVPLLNTADETTSPMTLAGKREIAFAIGPEPHQTIALAEIASGRIVRKIAPGKNAIDSLTSSPDGHMLYFASGGAIWAVASSGGEARKIAAGDSAIMEPSGTSLVVERNELARIRLFHVRLDGGPDQEISIDRSLPLFPRPLSPSAMDLNGRLLVALLPRDSWFVPVAVLDTATGRMTRVLADDLSDHQSSAWTPEGHIVTLQLGLRAALWKFTPEGR